MSNVIPGESYELKGDDYSIRVAPMGEKQEGNTYIDFMDCEKRLREYYNLTSNSTLSVFQTEVTSSNNKSFSYFYILLKCTTNIFFFNDIEVK